MFFVYCQLIFFVTKFEFCKTCSYSLISLSMIKTNLLFVPKKLLTDKNSFSEAGNLYTRNIHYLTPDKILTKMHSCANQQLEALQLCDPLLTIVSVKD